MTYSYLNTLPSIFIVSKYFEKTLINPSLIDLLVGTLPEVGLLTDGRGEPLPACGPARGGPRAFVPQT